MVTRWLIRGGLLPLANGAVCSLHVLERVLPASVCFGRRICIIPEGSLACISNNISEPKVVGV